MATRDFETAPAPHLPAVNRVQRVMALVLGALVPAIAVHAYHFGPGLLLQIALAVAFAMACEAAMLHLRGRPKGAFLIDLSAPVTAVLFALCIPPLAPWWVAAVAMVAAIVFAKQLYGGLGHNLFNPAMAGYAVVLLSFPLQLTRWLPADGAIGFGDALNAIFLGVAPPPGWDAVAQATPLDTVRELAAHGRTLHEIRADPAYAERGWAAVALAAAVGGAFLIVKRVIPWQTPAAVLGTTVLLTLPPWLVDADVHASPLHHLASGGLVLAAFFIATDPVTGCTTPRGRWIFGAGVAAIALAIRQWGAYPDGVAFAVLLMNCAAPWIDLHARPRYYGEARR